MRARFSHGSRDTGRRRRPPGINAASRKIVGNSGERTWPFWVLQTAHCTPRQNSPATRSPHSSVFSTSARTLPARARRGCAPAGRCRAGGSLPRALPRAAIAHGPPILARPLGSARQRRGQARYTTRGRQPLSTKDRASHSRRRHTARRARMRDAQRRLSGLVEQHRHTPRPGYRVQAARSPTAG